MSMYFVMMWLMNSVTMDRDGKGDGLMFVLGSLELKYDGLGVPPVSVTTMTV